MTELKEQNLSQHISHKINIVYKSHSWLRLHGRPGSSHWVDLRSLRSNYSEIAWNTTAIIL